MTRNPYAQFIASSKGGRLGLAFILGSLLISAWFVVDLIREQRWWASTFEVRFRTNDATGIWPGINVTISGYRVGKVERVELGADGLVAVDLRIDEHYRRLVGPKSTVSRRQEGFIGASEIQLSTDILPAEREVSGSDLLLPYEPGTDVAQLLEDLAETRIQLNKAVISTGKLLEADLPDAIRTFEGTLNDVRKHADTLTSETSRTAALSRQTLSVYQRTGQQVLLTSEEANQLMKENSPLLASTLKEIGTLARTTNRLFRALGGALLLGGPEARTDTGGGERSGKAKGQGAPPGERPAPDGPPPPAGSSSPGGDTTSVPEGEAEGE
jgi:phospholipid/cholesterol/gamma-HCH transport system substrate-binding protein